MSSNDRITEAHNRGEQDAASHISTPSSFFADLFAGVVSCGALGSNGNFNPPSDPDERAAYEAGYNNTMNGSGR